MVRTFKTSILISVVDGSETELFLDIKYAFSRAWAPDDTDPGSPPERTKFEPRLMKAGKIVCEAPDWLVTIVENDAQLEATMAAEWANAERAAESRAEELFDGATYSAADRTADRRAA